jgi:hypothetical protein
MFNKINAASSNCSIDLFSHRKDIELTDNFIEFLCSELYFKDSELLILKDKFNFFRQSIVNCIVLFLNITTPP